MNAIDIARSITPRSWVCQAEPSPRGNMLGDRSELAKNTFWQVSTGEVTAVKPSFECTKDVAARGLQSAELARALQCRSDGTPGCSKYYFYHIPMEEPGPCCLDCACFGGYGEKEETKTDAAAYRRICA